MKKIVTAVGLVGAIMCTNVSAGLIAHYDFSGNANDVTGNGYDGTVFGAALTTDRFGNANSAYLFNGLNDYIATPLLSSSLGGAFTISAWVYQTKTISGHPSMGAVHSDRQSFRGVGLSLAAGDKARFDIFKTNSSGDPNRNEMVGSIVPNSTWTLMTLTYEDGGFAKGYLNGVMDVSQAAIGTPHGSNFQIGHNPYDSLTARYWGGKIDDVRFYDTALSATEVQSLNSGGSVPEPGTLALFALGLFGIAPKLRKRVTG